MFPDLDVLMVAGPRKSEAGRSSQRRTFTADPLGGVSACHARSMRLCYHAALCPILHAPFREPVVAEDGHTYERSAIEAWLRHSSKRGRGAATAYLLRAL